MKKKGTDEEIIQWAISESLPLEPCTRDQIKDVWVCGSRRANMLSGIVKERLKETFPFLLKCFFILIGAFSLHLPMHFKTQN